MAPAPNAAARVPLPRPATFARPGLIQLFKMGDRPPPAYCVRQPRGEEQQKAFDECWELLLRRRGGEEVGDTIKEARLNVASILLELIGGRDTYQTKMFAYFLGLRQSAPAAIVGGLGNLKLDADGMVEGRPGFLRAPLVSDEVGAPGRALRHKTAWHNIKALLNAIQVTYGAGALGAVYDAIHGRVPQATAQEAHEKLQRVEATPQGRKVLWLALVLNSAPDNLWLGGAKENTSINTGASVFRRWTRALDFGEMSLAEYEARIRDYHAGSPKSRQAQAEILRIITDARGMDPREQTGHVVQMVFARVMTMLEIDLPDDAERAMQPHHLEIFKIAQGIGDLADHANIINQLLGLQPAPAAAAGGV